MALIVALVVVFVLVIAGGVWYYGAHQASPANSKNIPRIGSLTYSSTTGTGTEHCQSGNCFAITIPTTSTAMSSMRSQKDPYGLFVMATSTRGFLENSGVAPLVYVRDGVVSSGTYKGYTRLIADWTICQGVRDCPSYALLFITNNDQSFFLENSSSSEGALAWLAKNGVYLKNSLISGQAEIPFAFPESIGTGSVVFDNNAQYYNPISSSPLGQSLASPLGGLSFFADSLGNSSSGSSSSSLSAIGTYTVGGPLDGGFTNVIAKDTSGVSAHYSLDEYPFYGNGFLNGLSSSVGIFTSYGTEVCNWNQSLFVLKDISLSDLVPLGTNASGTIIYSLKDSNHPLNKALYYAEIASVPNFSSLNNGITPPSYGDFIAKHPLLIMQDPFGRFLGITQNEYTYIDPSQCGGL